MKINRQYIAHFITLMTAGLLASSASFAATVPSSLFEFTPAATTDVFAVKVKGWRDPAFGDMGWTHSSDWGTVSALQGQTINIKLIAQDLGLHPGITVWYRGTDDTAPDNYVVDHFYPQNANFTKFGATDDAGVALGSIVMRHVIHNYDADGIKKIPNMGAKLDAVSGQLTLKFKAAQAGTYIFVVGGITPDATLSTSAKYNVDVSVNVTGRGKI
jgi:hypothetical protein